MKKDRSKLKYMHTICGHPAHYVPGEQICYSTRGAFGAAVLVDSIKEIHKQRKLSIKWRRAHRLDPLELKNLGWINVWIP